MNPAAIEWIRTRPPSVQALMRRFPPGCLVRARARFLLLAPRPGELLPVHSYWEDGRISVCRGNTVFMCLADWLELARVRNGQDRAWIDRILAGGAE